MSEPIHLSLEELADALAAADQRRKEQLARALHDDVGQALSAVGVELDLLKLDSPALDARITAIQNTLETAFQHVRDITNQVTPRPADRMGLISALEGLDARMRRHGAGSLRITLAAHHELTRAEAAAAYEMAEFLAGFHPGVAIHIELAAGAAILTHDAPQSALCHALMRRCAENANLTFCINHQETSGTAVRIARKERREAHAI